MQQFCGKHGISLKETREFGRGVYSTKNKIKAGSIIWNESPLSYALKHNVCHHCWMKKKLYRCGNCKFARYCCKQCQSQDWKRFHKIRCKAISKLDGKMPTVTILSIAELLLNVQPHSNANCKPLLLKLQLELMPSLQHHWDKKTEDEKSDMNQVSLCIASYMKSVQETLQKTKKSSYNSQFKIDINAINATLGKFSTNAISICDDEFNTLGVGLFPLLAMINHCCAPNVFIKFNPHTQSAEIRALRDINKNEQLFINYTDITVPKFMRRRALFKDYCFECKCSFCMNNNEAICINLCCKKCGNVLSDIYECGNKQCRKKYDQNKLRQIVDDIERKSDEIKQNVEKIEFCYNVQKRRTELLQECRDCLSSIDKIVGKYHWLRLSIVKIMEKLQLVLNDFSNCYQSNVFILQFYEEWLDAYSPYLGIQYCLTGKLLNYLIHTKINEIYEKSNDEEKDCSRKKKKQLFELCERSCTFFEKGLRILKISHGNTPFIQKIKNCQQTARFNLENVSKR